MICVCMHPVLRVEARMDDVIHVEVEVVVTDAIRAWFLLRVGDDPWVFGHEPLVKKWYPHGNEPGELRCEEAEGMDED